MRFGVDFCLMILLIEFGGLDYLFSGGISFSMPVVVNYWLSMCFVFRSKKQK